MNHTTRSLPAFLREPILFGVACTSLVLSSVSAQETPSVLPGWKRVRTFNTQPRPAWSEWYLSRNGSYLMTQGNSGKSGTIGSHPHLWKVDELGRLKYLHRLPDGIVAMRSIEDRYLLVHARGVGVSVWNIEKRRRSSAHVHSSSRDWRWLSKNRLLETAGQKKNRLRVWRWRVHPHKPDQLRLEREVRVPPLKTGHRWFSGDGKWAFQINEFERVAKRIDLDTATVRDFPELMKFLDSRGRGRLLHAAGPNWAVILEWSSKLEQVTIRRFDLRQGRTLAPVTLSGWKGGIPGTLLRFSHDGEHGLLAGEGAVYFKTKGGKPVCRLAFPPQLGFVRRLEILRGRPFAIIHTGRRIAVFDLERGRLRHLSDEDHLYRIRELAFVGNDHLASLDYEGRVLIRNLKTGRIQPLVHGMPAHASNAGDKLGWRGLTPLPNGKGVLVHYLRSHKRAKPYATVLARLGDAVSSRNLHEQVTFDGKAVGFRRGGRHVLVNPRPFQNLFEFDRKQAPREILVYDSASWAILEKIRVPPYVRAWVLNERLLVLIAWIEKNRARGNSSRCMTPGRSGPYGRGRSVR